MTGSRNVAAALVAALVSTAIHVSGLIVLAPSSGVQMQGGAASMPARLGDGFADLAAGTMAPVGPGAVLAQAPVSITALSAPVAPMAASAAEPLPAAAQTGLVVALSSPAPEGAPTAAAPAPALVAPVAPTGLAPLPAGETSPDARTVRAPRPKPLPSPAPPEAAPAASGAAVEPAPAPVPDRLVASDPVTPALRPRPRPIQKAASRAGADPATGSAAPALARGNSDRNERRGASTGTGEAGGTSAQGAGAIAASAGNGAIENYGGKVMRRILKTRKVRAPARGTAVVGFSIAPDGRLASLRVLRSSGSADLDAVALDHLRRAQPFPKPPPGLRRDWSFEFVGQD